MSLARTLEENEKASLLKGEALRDRLNPKPGAKLYLHLADLRLALKRVETDAAMELLDFGCGGSPYQPLFPNAKYRRADLGGMDGLDYVIQPGSPLDAPDASFETILSTQVLEHVQDPDQYLRECRRLLCPGGRLVLSTHGTFPDHGAPWDFQRWTPHGLARDAERAGLKVEEQLRLTTGPRAVLQLWEMHMDRMPGRGGAYGLLFRCMRGLARRQRAGFHRWADLTLSEHQVAPAEDQPAHRLYLGLFLIARAL